jgi:hypothetical protein
MGTNWEIKKHQTSDIKQIRIEDLEHRINKMKTTLAVAITLLAKKTKCHKDKYSAIWKTLNSY